jgi:DNA-binding response OmpR family regulator
MTAKRVLLIDDDADLLHFLATRIRISLGMTVMTAKNALTALDWLQKQRFDLVITDVKMPTANGLSICETMDRNPFWEKTPVIVLTGQSDGETLARCVNLSAYYMHKSGDVWRRLVPVIEELVDTSPSEVAAEGGSPYDDCPGDC